MIICLVERIRRKHANEGSVEEDSQSVVKSEVIVGANNGLVGDGISRWG
jgi:hypothetical protein